MSFRGMKKVPGSLNQASHLLYNDGISHHRPGTINPLPWWLRCHKGVRLCKGTNFKLKMCHEGG